MTREKIRQWLVAIKRWSDRFFGVEAPEDECSLAPEYVRGWQDGFIAGEGNRESLLRVIQQLAKGR